ncbi:MAG: SMP-30/gluconolactonase/LRE family protein [Anaerolineales bacterium]|nr:SMP-30/gluconolactonase/LRE family protein [Anaerolineales bacterium]
MNVELIYEAKAALGEGPSWHAGSGRLYWVDIIERKIYLYQPADNRSRVLDVSDMVGCAVPAQSGELVLALRDRFVKLDLAAGKETLITALEGIPENVRFNDGKCDPAGRLVAGTMDMGEKLPLGALYSLDASGDVRKLLGGVCISNGLTWSPDYRTFYYIDTSTHQVQAFDYELETGSLSGGRVIIDVPEELGYPDGMTSDMEGNLWIAMWQGAQLTRWDPVTRDLLEQIPVPAKNVTSCIFGGPGMDELYITSARVGLEEATLVEYPYTGGLFRLKSDVKGIPTFVFGG